MSRWSDLNASPPPDKSENRIEVEGITAQCLICGAETYTTWYLPEVSALSWKCESCDHLNVLEEFTLP